MAIPLSKLTREQVLSIRKMYSDGVPVAQIEREFDVNWHTVNQCVLGGAKIDGKRMFDPLPLRKTLRKSTPRRKQWPAKPKAHRVRRANLVRHLWQTTEAQVIAIEARANLDTIASAEREREARAFAILVKTLQDLISMDREREGGKNTDAEVNYDDPGQIDDFRRELARRIEAIVAGSKAGTAGRP